MSRRTQEFGFGNVSGLSHGAQALADAKGKALAKDIRLERIAVIEGHNPRGQYNKAAFREDSLKGLVESIRERGVLSPVWVRPSSHETYALIAGERRYRAATLAGINEIPTLVFNVSEKEALLLALLENAQREQLHIVEETYVGFRMMQEHTGLSREALLQHLNKLRKGREPDTYGLEDLLLRTFNTGVSVWAQRRAKVFELTDEEAAAVFRDDLDFTTAVALTRLPVSRVRTTLFQRAIQEKLSAAQLKALIDTELSHAETPTERTTQELRKLLPKLGRLEGEKAQQAAKLVAELRTLTE